MKDYQINKMLDLLDDHLEKAQNFDGDSEERKEMMAIYDGMFVMAENILTSGYSSRSKYKGIEYEFGHHYVAYKNAD